MPEETHLTIGPLGLTRPKYTAHSGGFSILVIMVQNLVSGATFDLVYLGSSIEGSDGSALNTNMRIALLG